MTNPEIDLRSANRREKRRRLEQAEGQAEEAGKFAPEERRETELARVQRKLEQALMAAERLADDFSMEAGREEKELQKVQVELADLESELKDKSAADDLEEQRKKLRSMTGRIESFEQELANLRRGAAAKPKKEAGFDSGREPEKAAEQEAAEREKLSAEKLMSKIAELVARFLPLKSRTDVLPSDDQISLRVYQGDFDELIRPLRETARKMIEDKSFSPDLDAVMRDLAESERVLGIYEKRLTRYETAPISPAAPAAQESGEASPVVSAPESEEKTKEQGAEELEELETKASLGMELTDEEKEKLAREIEKDLSGKFSEAEAEASEIFIRAARDREAGKKLEGILRYIRQTRKFINSKGIQSLRSKGIGQDFHEFLKKEYLDVLQGEMAKAREIGSNLGASITAQETQAEMPVSETSTETESGAYQPKPEDPEDFGFPETPPPSEAAGPETLPTPPARPTAETAPATETVETLESRKAKLDAARRAMVLAEIKGDESAREASEREYEKARAEYVEANTHRMLDERLALVNERIGQHEQKDDWRSKIAKGYKKLGEWNLGNLIKKTTGAEKIGFEIKDTDSKFKRFFKRAANLGSNLVLNALSVRTALSLGMLGGAYAVGSVTAGLALMAGRRAMMGAGAGLGTYEGLKLGTNWFSKTFGGRREVNAEEIGKMNNDDILDALDQFEASAERNQERLDNNATYNRLGEEYASRAEIQSADNRIRQEMAEADADLNQTRKEKKFNDKLMKGVAVGVGALFGGGGFLLDLQRAGAAADALEAGKVRPAPGVAEAPYGPKPPETGGRIESVTGTGVETAAHLEYQGGDSVWNEIARQLEKRMPGKFDMSDSTLKPERIWLVDHFKNKVVSNPSEYGLPSDVEFTKMSPEQLKNMDWDKLFAESRELKLPSLTEAQQEAIRNYQPEVSVRTEEMIPPSFEELRQVGLDLAEGEVVPSITTQTPGIEAATGVESPVAAAPAEAADNTGRTAELQAQEALDAQKERVGELYRNLTASNTDNNLDIFENYVRELGKLADNDQARQYLNSYPKDRMAVLLYVDISKGIDSQNLSESFADPEKLAGRLHFWDNYLINKTADFKAGAMTTTDGYILDGKGQVVFLEKHGDKWKMFDLQDGNDWKEIKQNRALWRDRGEFSTKQAVKLLELEKSPASVFEPPKAVVAEVAQTPVGTPTTTVPESTATTTETSTAAHNQVEQTVVPTAETPTDASSDATEPAADVEKAAAPELAATPTRAELLFKHKLNSEAVAAINNFAEDKVFTAGVDAGKIEQVAQMTSEAERTSAIKVFSDAERASYARFQVKEALDSYLEKPDSATRLGILQSRVDPDLIRQRLSALGKPATEIDNLIAGLEDAFREVGASDALDDIRRLAKNEVQELRQEFRRAMRSGPP